MTVTAPPNDARTAQALDALQRANRIRLATASVKRDVRNGSLTLAEVATDRPEALCGMSLFTLLLELPGFGSQRLKYVGLRAVNAGINLAVTLGDASNRTLEWLVEEVTGDTDLELPAAEPNASAPPPSPVTPPPAPAGTEHAEIAQLAAALTAPPAQAVVEHPGWRGVALALDRLVLDHERAVRDESQPAERWAWADEHLHRDRALVMGSSPPVGEEPIG